MRSLPSGVCRGSVEAHIARIRAAIDGDAFIDRDSEEWAARTRAIAERGRPAVYPEFDPGRHIMWVDAAAAHAIREVGPFEEAARWCLAWLLPIEQLVDIAERGDAYERVVARRVLNQRWEAERVAAASAVAQALAAIRDDFDNLPDEDRRW